MIHLAWSYFGTSQSGNQTERRWSGRFAGCVRGNVNGLGMDAEDGYSGLLEEGKIGI